MRDVAINNGASVSRNYADAEGAELLAVFQYDGDAEAYARCKLAEDIERKWFGSRYIVVDHRSARVCVIQHKPEPVSA